MRFFYRTDHLALTLAVMLIATTARGDEGLRPSVMDPAARDFWDSETTTQLGRWLSSWLAETPEHPEWLAMFADILQGSQLGPTDGWFRNAGDSQNRHDWATVAARFDANGDSRITPDEFPGSDADFRRLDRNRDNALTTEDFDWSAHALVRTMGAGVFYLADRDGNGKVTLEELQALFEEADQDDLGFLSLDDLKAVFDPPPMPPPSSEGPNQNAPPQNAGPSKATLVKGLFQQEIGALQAGPALNEPAPDFTLCTLEGEEVTLSERLGSKPLVLVFGNLTCGPFRSQAGNVEKVFQRYRDRAEFLMVYIREAHPLDGWHMASNDFYDVRLDQPQTFDERFQVAQECRLRLDFDMPFLVDSMDDAVGATYSGMPSRLYVLDRDGKVAYKSGRGPFGFKPGELEQALIWTLLDQELGGTDQPENARSESAVQQSRVPLLDDAEAWAVLPKVEHGGHPPLPNWAKALAPSLPSTTAKMLVLNDLHRTGDHLDPILRAKIRWVAADANRSSYGKAYAEFDLQRAGLKSSAIEILAGDWSNLPTDERSVLQFARQMTLAADEVTDVEVARLIETHGEEAVVAMVHLLAYANFQDRLVLSLGVPVEPNGPLLPLGVAFDRDAKAPEVPPREGPSEGLEPPAAPEGIDDPLWGALDFDDLQAKLEAQRSGPGRIRVPTWEEVVARVPAFAERPAPSRVQWSLIGYGYQPELTGPWLDTMRTFGEEADQDLVFEESLFWVITRAIHCFY